MVSDDLEPSLIAPVTCYQRLNTVFGVKHWVYNKIAQNQNEAVLGIYLLLIVVTGYKLNELLYLNQKKSLRGRTLRLFRIGNKKPLTRSQRFRVSKSFTDNFACFLCDVNFRHSLPAIDVSPYDLHLSEAPMKNGDSGDNVKYIYRTSITLPSGKVIYAKNYGIRAFRIPVTEVTK